MPCRTRSPIRDRKIAAVTPSAATQQTWEGRPEPLSQKRTVFNTTLPELPVLGSGLFVVAARTFNRTGWFGTTHSKPEHSNCDCCERVN